jgi:hypothetical protein
MTTDEIAAQLYHQYHLHMGTDLDAWRRNQEKMPPRIKASFRRCAEWVKRQFDADQPGSDRRARSGLTNML